jgi:hypothetical protein
MESRIFTHSGRRSLPSDAESAHSQILPLEVCSRSYNHLLPSFLSSSLLLYPQPVTQTSSRYIQQPTSHVQDLPQSQAHIPPRKPSWAATPPNSSSPNPPKQSAPPSPHDITIPQHTTPTAAQAIIVAPMACTTAFRPIQITVLRASVRDPQRLDMTEEDTLGAAGIVEEVIVVVEEGVEVTRYSEQAGVGGER